MMVSSCQNLNRVGAAVRLADGQGLCVPRAVPAVCHCLCTDHGHHLVLVRLAIPADDDVQQARSMLHGRLQAEVVRKGRVEYV